MGARALAAGLLVELVAVVFAQVRHHGFVDFDEYTAIVDNPALEVASPAEALRVAEDGTDPLP